MKQSRLLGTALLLGLSLCSQPPAAAEPSADLWKSEALKTPFRENISEDEKVAGLSELWSEVKYNFVNADRVPGLDWDGLYLSSLPRVRQTRSTLEYYKLLTALCARLKDGHTNVYPPPELMDQLDARPPLRTALVEGRVLVTDVWSDALRRSGIRPGIEVLAVDGIPVRQYGEERVAPYESSSTRQDLDVRVYTYSLLAGAADRDVGLTLRDDRGNTFLRTVRRGTYPDALRPPTPSVAFRVLPGNIGYVALNSFEGEDAPKIFEAALPAILRTDALILDLRLNGGGDGDVGFSILGHLTDKGFQTPRWRTRQYRPTSRAWGQGETWYAQEPETRKASAGRSYGNPVVLLTSGRTFSAAEDFCVAFAAMKRGVIVGEPTAGSTGQPLHFALPGGGFGRVCTKHDSYPDGKEFIGVGVQPQELVHPSVSDLRAGRDTVLEAALRRLKRGG